MAPRDQPDPSLIAEGSRERRAPERLRDMGSPTSPARPTSPKKRGSAHKPNSVIDVDALDVESGNMSSRGKKRTAAPTSDSPQKRPRTNQLKAAVDVDASQDIDMTSTSNGKSLGDPTTVDEDDFLADIVVSSLAESKKPKGDGNKDINHFLGNAPGAEKASVHTPQPSDAIWSLITITPITDGPKRRALPPLSQAIPTLDNHLHDIPPKERVIPYSHAAFRQAAIEWLVATNQPVDVLDHPKFRNMIDITSRATDGVRIPGKKLTREEIIELFKRRMDQLKAKLNGPTVTGEIQLTDDAWTASHGDGYLGVTGHWIEEVIPGGWESREALIGFVRLNNAHNGVRLGQALYKVVARLGIQKRIHNNRRCRQQWYRGSRVLISKYSNATHFDPKQSEAHLPDTTAPLRDEIGLVRATTVKACPECSSPKRKQIFKELQLKICRAADSSANVGVFVAKQLILDMKVRWSSTYYMLLRALELHEAVDEFVVDISYDGANAEERAKVKALKLTREEWKRVDKFTGFLAYAEKAQQAFSSGTIPSLHNAIPALEVLHSAWSKKADIPSNSNYAPALNSVAEKINEYYQKTILNPKEKGRYFEKHWGTELAKEARETAMDISRERWQKLNAGGVTSRPPPQHTSKLGRLLREITPESDEDDTFTVHRNPSQPSLGEFEEYYDSHPEFLSDNMSMVSWWGACLEHFPTWRSLARDRLCIPASFVSSERAFSAGGITISKQRNRLKGDIVEALQVLKSLIRGEDMFCAPAVSTIEEDEDDLKDDSKSGWDCFLDDAPDNYEPDVTME
ncbi:putative AC transposase [Mycena venus]|uniref:Putative AC transposase n=1 Tax=Mycena venus TaxID=2733690 RepID=A0A8H7DGJ1_9AGAR|nr:putative AC transposase [Mycena venus]